MFERPASKLIYLCLLYEFGTEALAFLPTGEPLLLDNLDYKPMSLGLGKITGFSLLGITYVSLFSTVIYCLSPYGTQILYSYLRPSIYSAS